MINVCYVGYELVHIFETLPAQILVLFYFIAKSFSLPFLDILQFILIINTSIQVVTTTISGRIYWINITCNPPSI